MQAARGTPLSTSRGHDTEDPRPGVPGRRRILLFLVVVALSYATDVITKIIAVARLEGPPVKTVTVIPNVLDLTLVRNSGAAFGIATGFTVILTMIAVGVCLVVLRMVTRLRDPLWTVALGLLLGGALGNLTDRFAREPGPMRGHVIDFFQLPHWPVFNIADCCVSIAAVMIAVQSFRGVGLDGRRVGHGADARSEPDDGAASDDT
ncbi:MAG: signal peptidase II [Nocardioidaceae bacterium]